MTTIETWTCPLHGIVAKGVRGKVRPVSMTKAIASHRIHDHCYAFLSIQCTNVSDVTTTLISEKLQGLSEETKDE